MQLRFGVFCLIGVLLIFSCAKIYAQSGGRNYFHDGYLDIVSSSHQDIAWMDTPQACEEYRIDHVLIPAMKMMRENPRYCFSMENMLNLMELLSKHPELKSEIYKFTRERRLEWGATYNQPYESLLSGEELVRELYYGRRWLLKNFPGCDTRVAFTMDVPGRAMQMQQILSKAGVPYLMISRFHEGLHQWRSPDGSGVIAYSPGHYVNPSALLNQPPANAVRAIEEKLDKEGVYYRKYQIPPDYILLHTNDFDTPVDFNPLIDLWNKSVQPVIGSEMRYSTARTFFDSISSAKSHLNTVTGERPNVWMYIHGPTHHHMISAKRDAAVLLPEVEMFQMVKCLLDGSFQSYPEKSLNKAWMSEIYLDHGIGGNNGNITDEIFKNKELYAKHTAQRILHFALLSIASRVRITDPNSKRVVVFNGLAWKRSSPVVVPIRLNPKGHYLLKDPEGLNVPFQFTTLDQPSEINVATRAMGAHAYASSWMPGYGPEKVIDGRWWNAVSDRWVSSNTTTPQWVIIDFGKTRIIDHVTIRHEGAAGIFNDVDEDNTADFRIMGTNSPDEPWINLVPPVTGNRSVYTSVRFSPRSIRYLCVYITRPASRPNQPARIFEVCAYEKNVQETPHPIFIADNTPAIGYSAYTFKSVTHGSKPVSSDVQANDKQFQNRFYRIMLASGGVKSVYDMSLKRELLNTGKFLGFEVFTMQSVGTGAGEFGEMQMPTMQGFDKLSNYPSKWRIIENGPVRTCYEFTQVIPHVTVQERLDIYNTIKRINCHISLLNWDGEKYREFRMALPLNEINGRVAYAVPMGVDEVGKSEIKTNGGFTYAGLDYSQQCSDIHPREVQDFMDASDKSFGVTMSSSVAVCDYIDPTTNPVSYPVLQPILLASRRSCNGTGNWYLQPGNHDYMFSVFSHLGDWRKGYHEGLEATHPLLPTLPAERGGGGGLPLKTSFFSVSPQDSLITTIKKCEDDDGVVIRMCEMEGKNTILHLKSLFPILSAQHTNILEMDPTPMHSKRDGLDIGLGYDAIETVKLKMSRTGR